MAETARRGDEETEENDDDTVIPSVIVKLMAKGTRPRVSTRCWELEVLDGSLLFLRGLFLRKSQDGRDSPSGFLRII
ncbi:hypothetical protein K0M31_000288 [Melipona bicolor]|uniref:Uncharacterized protein n=1 Tax=Melipona bicolor TaxID=60889 RepID=A0AA40GD70_9HYME|nr:hypothetical protein K0M31_000288 [Melipona bicolor]